MKDTLELWELFRQGAMKCIFLISCSMRGVKTITTLEGYKDLLIYPPSVLLEGDDEDDDETDSE